MMRFAVLLLVALTACAPQLAKRGTEHVTPSLSQNVFVARDGAKLAVQSWPAPKPEAVIVALHGMSDYANAFAMPAPWWADRAITTYAFDQRGFGRSDQVGLWAGGEAMVEDVHDFVDAVRAKHPNVPIILLGESMGGAAASAAMGSAKPPKADALILVAPAFWGWSNLNLLYRSSLWLTAHTFPDMVLTGSGLKLWPSDNIEMLRAFSRDPLVIKGARTDAVYGLVSLMDDGYRAAPKIKVPTLILFGKKDEIVPLEPVAAAAKAWGVKPRVVLYARGYHMLMRDLQREHVWQDIAAFVKDRTAPLPSGEEVDAEQVEPDS